MEKLFDLLKQHCRKRYWFKDNDDLEIDTDSVCFHLYLKWERLFPIRVETVICKEFWFIKWLADNDKIDYKKLREEREDLCDVNLRHLRNKYIDVVSLSYVKLLMLLSISDTPIEDLISYLK